MVDRQIIWDWNGTLLNDIDAALAAANQMLASRDLPTLTLDRYREIFGFPVRGFYRLAGFRLETEDWDAMACEFHRIFLSQPTMRLFDDTIPALEHFQKSGYRQVMLSASKQELLTGIIGQFKLTPYFDAVKGIDTLYGTSKIELGKELLRQSPIPPERTVMIGDTLHDAEVAAALGTSCILVARGHQSLGRLQTTGVPLAANLSELRVLLGE
ncbi:MAG: HAD family hydrolase [Kiritimatiellae bacterium]|nr:HAD family hydrolase [Kiritimatiellia bacterium]